VFLSYDNTLVGGYVISTNSTKVTEQRNWVQFSFTLFVTSYAQLQEPGNPNAYQGFPIKGITDYSKVEASLSEDFAAVMRPALLPNNGNIPISGHLAELDSAGKTQMLSLEEGLTKFVGAASKAWNSAQKAVNSVIAGVSGLQNGDYVRIPVGFEGAMAFDDGANVNLQTVQYGGPIKYTTFSDNVDEYVGVGDHYGTSSVRSKLGYRNRQTEMVYNQKMVDEARKVWAANGIEVPSLKMGPVSRFLVGKGVGLLGVGSTALWTKFSANINKAGSAVLPFASGSSSIPAGYK
jgi:hypothetical protein